MGQAVRTLVSRRYAVGFYDLTWDGKDGAGNALPSGVYIYRLETDQCMQAKRMTLLK